MNLPSKSTAHIAVNTLGLGAREGDLETAAQDPQGYVLSQINTGYALLGAPHLQSAENAIRDYLAARAIKLAERRGKTGKAVTTRKKTAPSKSKQTSNSNDRLPEGQKDDVDTQSPQDSIYRKEMLVRDAHAVSTPHSFTERWVRFWSNHFTVAGRHPLQMRILGAFEREAIRPHVFSDFKSLLRAASLHQAMLIYLDNNLSVGPNSRMGRNQDKSYNENLAREILELHTLGVDGGYDIDDIISFAKALTGWTVGIKPSRKNFGLSDFVTAQHEPGAQTIMGQFYTQEDGTQATAVLDWLAAQPQTARFIASKLALHFAGHKEAGLIDRLTDNFMQSGGDLTALATTLVTDPVIWSQNPWRYKTPEEFILSTARALPKSTAWQDAKIAPMLGQAPFRAPSPQGWALEGSDWINGENLLQRLTWLGTAVADTPSWVNVAYLSQQALGTPLSAAIADMDTGRVTRANLLRMVFMSPEFLQR